MKKIDISYLTDFLRDKYEEIQIAYIFGSSKNGNVKDRSDIDIAVYLTEKASSFLQFKIATDLEEEFNIPIDVVVLNKANPILAHEVLRNGKRLFERDNEFRAFVELRIFKDYIDNSYYLMRRYG